MKNPFQVPAVGFRRCILRVACSVVEKNYTNLPTIHGGEFDGDEFHGIESATNHYWKRKVKILSYFLIEEQNTTFKSEGFPDSIRASGQKQIPCLNKLQFVLAARNLTTLRMEHLYQIG